MSMKRRPENELNHDNWDDEEEAEREGKFEKAPDDELKGRVIRVAKRRVHSGSGAPAVGAEPRANAFAAFSGFGGFAKGTSSDNPMSKTPFGGSGAGALSTFKFGGTSTSTASTPIGSSTTSPFGGNAANDLKKPTGDEKSAQFCSKLRELNSAVLQCIKGHIDSNKLCILSPIFTDYIKYVQEIEAGEKATLKTTTPTATFASTTENSTKDEPKKFTFATVAPVNASSSNAKVESKNDTEPAEKQPSLFSFGTSTATPFSFGKPSGGFGSGAAPSIGFGAQKSANNDDAKKDDGDKADGGDEEKDEAPPKNEFTAVVESDSIYTKRVKVFVKTDKDYSNRGTGTLYLKEVGEKIQLIVRADTNLGNILINILLSSSIPSKRMGKNNVMLICIPTPESDPKPTAVLLRVKNEEEADELLAEISKHQK